MLYVCAMRRDVTAVDSIYHRLNEPAKKILSGAWTRAVSLANHPPEPYTIAVHMLAIPASPTKQSFFLRGLLVESKSPLPYCLSPVQTFCVWRSTMGASIMPKSPDGSIRLRPPLLFSSRVPLSAIRFSCFFFTYPGTALPQSDANRLGMRQQALFSTLQGPVSVSPPATRDSKRYDPDIGYDSIGTFPAPPAPP